MDNEIDVREYLAIIRKRAWIIALITTAAVLVSGAVSFFLLVPVYSTSVTLMVSRSQENQDVNIQYQDILISHRLVNTYSEIARSNRVLYRAIDVLGLDITAEQLRQKILVASVRDTEIIRISVQNADREFTTALANTLARIFMEEVVSIMRMDNVQVIDLARLPSEPISPRPILNMAIAGVLGIMMGLGLIFLIEFLDNTVKTPEAIEERLELPVLGVIPSFDRQ